MPAPAEHYVPVKAVKPAIRMEVRCHAATAVNNLDIGLDKPLDKYSLIVHRTGEPQDDKGERVGPRVTLPNFSVPMAAVLSSTFTAAGVTLTGAQILALFNQVIDTYKGEGDLTSKEA